MLPSELNSTLIPIIKANTRDYCIKAGVIFDEDKLSADILQSGTVSVYYDSINILRIDTITRNDGAVTYAIRKVIR